MSVEQQFPVAETALPRITISASRVEAWKDVAHDEIMRALSSRHSWYNSFKEQIRDGYSMTADKPQLKAFARDVPNAPDKDLLIRSTLLDTTLDQIIYGLYNTTTHDVRTAYAHMYEENFLDAGLLHTHETRTETDPIHFVGIKWIAFRSPAPAVVKSREFIFFSYDGSAIDANGHRVLFRFLRTMPMDDVVVDSSRMPSLVRGRISNLHFYRQHGANVSVYTKAMHSNAGNMPSWIVAKTISFMYPGIANVETVADARALMRHGLSHLSSARLSAHHHSSLASPSSSLSASSQHAKGGAMPRPPSSAAANTCDVCLTKLSLGRSKRTCHGCSQSVCKSCTRSMCLLDEKKELSSTAVARLRFCRNCVLRARAAAQILTVSSKSGTPSNALAMSSSSAFSRSSSGSHASSTTPRPNGASPRDMPSSSSRHRFPRQESADSLVNLANGMTLASPMGGPGPAFYGSSTGSNGSSTASHSLGVSGMAMASRLHHSQGPGNMGDARDQRSVIPRESYFDLHDSDEDDEPEGESLVDPRGPPPAMGMSMGMGMGMGVGMGMGMGMGMNAGTVPLKRVVSYEGSMGGGSTYGQRTTEYDTDDYSIAGSDEERPSSVSSLDDITGGLSWDDYDDLSGRGGSAFIPMTLGDISGSPVPASIPINGPHGVHGGGEVTALSSSRVRDDMEPPPSSRRSSQVRDNTEPPPSSRRSSQVRDNTEPSPVSLSSSQVRETTDASPVSLSSSQVRDKPTEPTEPTEPPMHSLVASSRKQALERMQSSSSTMTASSYASSHRGTSSSELEGVVPPMVSAARQRSTDSETTATQPLPPEPMPVITSSKVMSIRSRPADSRPAPQPTSQPQPPLQPVEAPPPPQQQQPEREPAPSKVMSIRQRSTDTESARHRGADSEASSAQARPQSMRQQPPPQQQQQQQQQPPPPLHMPPPSSSSSSPADATSGKPTGNLLSYGATKRTKRHAPVAGMAPTRGVGQVRASPNDPSLNPNYERIVMGNEPSDPSQAPTPAVIVTSGYSRRRYHYKGKM